MINEWKGSRSALWDGGEGGAEWGPHISKQDLNQTLVIPVTLYKLRAVEIVPGRMSVCTQGWKRRKKKKKSPWSLEDRDWSSLGEGGWKSSKFTVTGRCLNVPFKLRGTCHKGAGAPAHPTPCFCFSFSLFFFPFQLSCLPLPDTGSPNAPSRWFPFTLVHHAPWFSGNIKKKKKNRSSF